MALLERPQQDTGGPSGMGPSAQSSMSSVGMNNGAAAVSGHMGSGLNGGMQGGMGSGGMGGIKLPQQPLVPM